VPTSEPAKTTLLQRLRHVAGIAVGAAILIFALEPLLLPNWPLLDSLSPEAREDLYKQLSVVAVTLMGFLVTAVAILVSLDRGREIVQELHRGESYSLLVLNLLAAVVLLFMLSLMSIVGGAAIGGIGSSCLFIRLLEWLCLMSLAEVALGGFFFCVVTYKVASYH